MSKEIKQLKEISQVEKRSMNSCWENENIENRRIIRPITITFGKSTCLGRIIMETKE